MHLEVARVEEHRDVVGGYRLLVFSAPKIASAVRPGQFVHLRIPGAASLVLRRPFSVYWAEGERLAILYKTVGQGTQLLSQVGKGVAVSLLGPLGNGFPAPSPSALPVLVAGGYGAAALYLVARNSDVKGIFFTGAKTRAAVLCPEAFAALGWEVRIATEDGSEGFHGLVTGALDEWLSKQGRRLTPEFFACGPNGMLRAVGDIAIRGGWKAWLSLDRRMGCGVGACLTCVIKIREDSGEETWKRCCRDGPVFECRQIVWGSIEEEV